MRTILKKTKGLLAPLLCTVALSSAAMATESNVINKKASNVIVPAWYGGVGFTGANAKCIDGCEDITYGLVAKVGANFNQYIGMEVRATKTFLEYEQQEVQHLGVYAKPMYPINDVAYVYGLVGYGQISTGDKIVYDNSGLTWGVGFQYNPFEKKKNLGIFIDYQKLLQESNTPDFDALNLGLVYNF
jgi:opacity protein-like surface antigen